MTTDQLLQLGSLIVATLGLAGGIAYAVWRWTIARYRSLRVSVFCPSEVRAYIHTLGIGEQGVRIYSVATWCLLRLANVGPEPVLISAIRAYEKGRQPRGVVGPPVRTLAITWGAEVPEQPVDLPLTLAPQHGTNLWVLITTEIPEPLGLLLFKLFGDRALEQQTVRLWAEHRHNIAELIRQDAQQEIAYAQITKLTFGEVLISEPLLKVENGKATIAARFGIIPINAGSRVLSELVHSPEERLPVVGASATHYVVELELGSGKTWVRRWRTGQDAFWFLRPPWPKLAA